MTPKNKQYHRNAWLQWRSEVENGGKGMDYARVIDEPETDEKRFVQHGKQNRAG